MCRKNFWAAFVLIASLFLVAFISGGCGGGSDGSVEGDKDTPSDNENINYEEGAIQNILNSAVAVVNLGYQGGNNSRYVTENIELPESSEGIGLSWESSNSGVISNNGTVSRPTEGNTNVTLTVFAESMDFVASRDFEVTVIKKRARTIEQAKVEIEEAEISNVEDMNINDDFFQMKYSEAGDQISLIDGQFTNISVDNADDAQDVVWSMRELLGIEDPYEEIELFNVAQAAPTENESGDVEGSDIIEAIAPARSYSFAQVCKVGNVKLPVFGRSLTVSANGNGVVNFLSSNLLQTEMLKKIEQNTAEMDDVSIGVYALKDYPEGSLAITSDIGRIIYSIGKDDVNNYELNPVKAYTVRVLGTDEYGYSLDDTVVVEAKTGRPIKSYPNVIADNLTRTGQDELGNVVTFPVTPKYQNGVMTKIEMKNDFQPLVEIYNRNASQNSLVFRTPDNTWSNKTQISAYINMIKVAQWFYDRFGQKSVDNNGKVIKLITHYGTDNAYWLNENEVICLGDLGDTSRYAYTFGVCPDTFAHEMGHAILFYTTNRSKMTIDASGAINEAYGDIFGHLMEEDWKHGWVKNDNGDSATGITFCKGRECLRDAAQDVTVASISAGLSSNYKNLSKITTVEELYEAYKTHLDPDHNGVHDYCRLITHAAYLMHEDGATKIGRASYGLNWQELGNIWYDSIAGLNENSNFHSVRTNVIAAARKRLSIQKIITIKKAFDAVGITEPQGRFTGRITDSSGNPIPQGAEISIRSSLTDNQDVKTYTDVNGYFTISADAGIYSITIKSVNGNYNSENFRKSIDEDQEVDISTKLTRSGTGILTVTAKDENGNAMYNVQFSLKNSLKQQIARNSTNINGQCTFNEILAGNYTLHAVKEGYPEQTFSLRVEPNTVNAVTEVIQKGTGTLSLTVKDGGGTSMVGVQILLRNESGQQVSWKFTNISGKCTFNNVPCGRYTLLVAKRNKTQNISSDINNKSIKVEMGLNTFTIKADKL